MVGVLLPKAGATFQPGQNGRVSEPSPPILTAEDALVLLLTYSEQVLFPGHPFPGDARRADMLLAYSEKSGKTSLSQRHKGTE